MPGAHGALPAYLRLGLGFMHPATAQ